VYCASNSALCIVPPNGARHPPPPPPPGTYHEVCECIGVVEAAVAAGCNDVIQVIGWQAEVGDDLVVTVQVLYVDLVVLHELQ
jgi:hypothetical protein